MGKSFQPRILEVKKELKIKISVFLTFLYVAQHLIDHIAVVSPPDRLSEFLAPMY